MFKVCYTPGELTFTRQRRYFTDLVKKCYPEYLGSPYMLYILCYTFDWMGKHNKPYDLRNSNEPRDHISDCYYCLLQLKAKQAIKYPSLSYARGPMSHNEELLLPTSPESVAKLISYSRRYERLRLRT